MKKALSILLVLVMCLSLCACGKETDDLSSNAGGTGTNNTQKNDKTGANELGEMVSTDILELTIHDAALSYYATADAVPADNSSVYVANKGKTLVCLEFTLTNTDRATLDTRDILLEFNVKQNGNKSRVDGYKQAGLYLFGMPISENGQDFVTNNSSNILISAGSTVRIKYVGIISFDADLSSPFELVAKVKTSSGRSEDFLYTIG